jgi:hypothetical protein
MKTYSKYSNVVSAVTDIPDALFDTRTGLTITDSIGGLTASLKDFIYFNHKSGTALVSRGTTTYIPPSEGDITAVIFVKPNQSTVGSHSWGQFGGNNSITFNHSTKNVTGTINGSSINGILTIPDPTNYITNLYMAVWKYVASETKAYIRVYNTATNYTEKSEVAAFGVGNDSSLIFSQITFGGTCGLLMSLYFTSNLSDSQLTALWNGTIPVTSLTSLVSFCGKETIRAYHYDSVEGGKFDFVTSGSDLMQSGYYDLRTTNIQVAYPLIYGYTKKSLNQIPYTPSLTKGTPAEVGDVEYPSTSCLWNMADCRLYFDAVTDATIKAIFDKANRTYWKASIESEDHYINAGSGYYGVWGAEQLQRDFIEIHGETDHKNHIFTSLRTSDGTVTGITAIRVYKTNLT